MIRCSFTDDRPSGGLASIYWAWFTEDHRRIARKVHYCLPCYEALVATAVRRSATTPQDERYESCLACGETLTDDGALIYGTLYAPKSEPFQFELWYCFPCFDKERGELATTGDELPDRNGPSSAPKPSPWAAVIPDQEDPCPSDTMPTAPAVTTVGAAPEPVVAVLPTPSGSSPAEPVSFNSKTSANQSTSSLLSHVTKANRRASA